MNESKISRLQSFMKHAVLFTTIMCTMMCKQKVLKFDIVDFSYSNKRSPRHWKYFLNMKKKIYITFRNVAQLSTKAVGINIPIKHQPAQSWVFICTFVWSCKLLWFCSLEDFAFSSNDNLAVLTLHEVSLYYFFLRFLWLSLFLLTCKFVFFSIFEDLCVCRMYSIHLRREN